jgi:hypothetical protein
MHNIEEDQLRNARNRLFTPSANWGFYPVPVKIATTLWTLYTEALRDAAGLYELFRVGPLAAAELAINKSSTK